MANIFAILTAVALAAGALFAFKNQQAYEEAIEQRKEAKEVLDRDTEEHKDLVAERDQTIAERKEAEAETVKLTEEENGLKSANEGIRSGIDSKREQTEKNATVIDKLKADTAELGDITTLAGDIKKLQEQIVGLQDDVAGAKVMQSNLTGEKERTGETIKAYQTRAGNFANRVSYGSARITAIFGPWGFVTLSAGASGGIVPGSRLDIVRDGGVVGQLQVRSAESGRASADVIPDTLAEGTVLMVGDRVVPAGQK